MFCYSGASFLAYQKTERSLEGSRKTKKEGEREIERERERACEIGRERERDIERERERREIDGSDSLCQY